VASEVTAIYILAPLLRHNLIYSPPLIWLLELPKYYEIQYMVVVWRRVARWSRSTKLTYVGSG